MENKQLLAFSINCDNFTEKKGGLTYLSWANAWGEFKKVHPNSTYNILKNEENIPLFGNEKLGYMVYTNVTVADITHEMWLPVLDFKNKAMKNPDMYAINKSVMRCLTKNLAMFGLGLNIYQGEDFPESQVIDEPIDPITPSQLKQINILISEMGVDTKVKEQKYKIYKWMGVTSLKTIGSKKAVEIIAKLKEAKIKKGVK